MTTNIERPFDKLHNLIRMLHFNTADVLTVMGLTRSEWDDLVAGDRELRPRDVVDILRVMEEPIEEWIEKIYAYEPVVELKRKERYAGAYKGLRKQFEFIRGVTPAQLLTKLNTASKNLLDELANTSVGCEPGLWQYYHLLAIYAINQTSGNDTKFKVVLSKDGKLVVWVGSTFYEYDDVKEVWTRWIALVLPEDIRDPEQVIKEFSGSAERRQFLLDVVVDNLSITAFPVLVNLAALGTMFTSTPENPTRRLEHLRAFASQTGKLITMDTPVFTGSDYGFTVWQKHDIFIPPNKF